MPRRSPSNIEFFLFLPWWVSAVLGVLSYFLSAAFIRSFANTSGALGKGITQGAGWVPAAFLCFFGVLAVGAAIIRWKRGERLESQNSIESIRGLSWEAFEGLVAEAYRRKGFVVEQSLAGGTDGGVDLVLKKDGQTILVQCKQWRTSAVGAPIIREIYGVLMHEKADRALVIASGHFTREAELFAAGKPMELIDGDQLLRLVQDVQVKKTERSTTRIVSVAKTSEAPSPLCPLCGAEMKLRTAKRGTNAGNTFWGCSTYPKCQGTRKA